MADGTHGAKPWHEVLGVDEGAPWEAIRTAYLRLAADYHPDKVAAMPIGFQEFAAERMKAINAAYDIAQKQRETRVASASPSGTVRSSPPPPPATPKPSPRGDYGWIVALVVGAVLVIVLMIFDKPNSADVRPGPAVGSPSAASPSDSRRPPHVAAPPSQSALQSPPAMVPPPRDQTVAEVYDQFGQLKTVPIQDFEYAVCAHGYRPGPNAPSMNVTVSIAPGRVRRIYCKCAGLRFRVVYDASGTLHLASEQAYAANAPLGLIKDALAWPHQKEIDPGLCVQAINNGPLPYPW